VLVIAGAIIVLVSVGAGYVLSHGQLLALWQPFELLIIGGAAFGAYLSSNPLSVHKAVLRYLIVILKGAPYKRKNYIELLMLLHDLLQKSKVEGMLKLENDIDNPNDSPLFQSYPGILANHEILTFVCDYVRILLGGGLDNFQLQELMEMELDTHHQESELPATAVNLVADALPGFGIVAAVLGIVITMGSLGDGDTAALGMHVAAALVGTFLGILLAYGFVAPLAIAMGHAARDEAKFFECAKVCLLAGAQGYNPKMAVEFGRKVLFHKDRPTFDELDTFLRAPRQNPESPEA
jgi:chemotaxis protein MotA